MNDNFYLPIHRGFYMSAHVLLNLLNELGKSDKMRCVSHLCICVLTDQIFNKYQTLMSWPISLKIKKPKFHLDKEERTYCFALVVCQVSCFCQCSVVLPQCAVGWSEVCGISWSYSLTGCGFSLFSVQNKGCCYRTPIKVLLWLTETSLHWLWQIIRSNSDELRTLCQCWQTAKKRSC